MWKEIVEKTGVKRWDYSIVSGTGDMPVFEYGGHIEEDPNGDDWLYAYDKNNGFITHFLELDDAKKAVEEAARGRKYF